MTVASPKITSIEKARQSLRPVQPEFAKKKLSSYFPKDSIFNKIKTYLLKNKEGQEQKLDADWRHLHLGGFKVILFKGVALSNEQLEHFDKGARAYYLESRKPTAAQIKAEAKAKAEVEVEAEVEAQAKAEAEVEAEAIAKAEQDKLDAEGKE